MIKFVTALIAALVAGLVLAGSTYTASARQGYSGCHACGGGPIAPTTYYKTVHPQRSFTRYHDVSVYNRVNRVHRIVNVVRIQPIVRIHDVTRVHHHTIFHTINAYASVTQRLTPIQYVDRSVRHHYDCGCGNPYP